MFCHKIKLLREQKKLTQKELALTFNLSQSSIALYEKGIRTPDFKTLSAYASFFNVSTDYLLGIEISKNSLIKETSDVDYNTTHFYYKMCDNSMREIGILKGASVLIEWVNHWEAGDILLFEIKNNNRIEKHLRTLVVKNNLFILKAENVEFESFLYTDKNDFKVIGKAIEVKTSFENSKAQQ